MTGDDDGIADGDCDRDDDRDGNGRKEQVIQNERASATAKAVLKNERRGEDFGVEKVQGVVPKALFRVEA